MAGTGQGRGLDRRTLLIGGGAAAGLLIAWELWPRAYRRNLIAAPGESILNAFLKISADGHVAVVVPQVEMGQGVYTVLPQILADELGADWRAVGVEPAPVGPLYANELLAAEAAGDRLPAMLHGVGAWAERRIAVRPSLMITAGSSSIRAFEVPFREAGAAARTLLCMAAARRWGVDPAACDTAQGFVVRGDERLRFGELAAEAAALEPPAEIALRGPAPPHSPPRLDMPAKIDGSARFAADVRLADMVYAAIRQAPADDATLAQVDTAAANRIAGVLAVVQNPGWVAVVATSWWAARRGVDALRPRFARHGAVADSATIDAALARALEGGPATRFAAAGDTDAALAGGQFADFAVPLAVHAAIEPMAATAHIVGDRLELWVPTQAPGIARAAAARAIGFAEDDVTVYPMLVGGSFGRKIETDAAVQAAILAQRLRRPVQLMWSRAEDLAQDRFRPPARARMAAKLGRDGAVLAWRARIAAPSTRAEVDARLRPDRGRGGAVGAEPAAVAGAVPPYTIPAIAIDHVPVEIGIATGMWRSVAHSYTAFFSECFVDELAHQAGVEPLSFRMQMLGQAPRLAHCLSTATALGGWEGGAAGSGQGIAAHSAFGSHVAMLAEVHVGRRREIVVDRIVAVVDCGRSFNDDVILQQIEGGIIWGLAAALGATTGVTRGVPDARNFDTLGLPRLATTPEIVVQLVRSAEPCGGVGEVGVPPVAPAIANALFTVTGRRHRSLPLRADA